ncbi:glycosyltransferase family 4 protein [Synechococcus sp. CBW1006]|uniref:glycosyltransferase family 4 protein n=1 Tax=Synechococcus sp. CBW1006 TaxID=1353138 RepID=UPI001E4DB698|nr:glycosyltransferase family 4 protein [Synechococcus sp. CBW1006]
MFALHRIGPYHRVRLEAAAQAGLRLMVLQTRPQSQEYPWKFDPAGCYQLESLRGAPHPEADPPQPELDRQLQQLLAACTPEAIVSVGWADPAYQRLLIAAQQRRIPILIVSDSRWRDQARSWPREWIKCQLLRGYSAALVAGHESRAYLEGLGFPAAGIFQPWDVVDNAFFATATDLAAASSQLRLSPPRFLCVSRLVEKKNHCLLLQAYGAYQRQGGRWGLQLVGSGPLEAAIRQQIRQLPDPSRVELLPFAQLDQLGSLYGQASAFVLASSSDQWGLVVNEAMAAGLPCLVSSACGCTADLIEHGRTGWCFDPSDPEGLARLMHQAESQSPLSRAAMVLNARTLLQSYSPSAFARALRHALQWAGQHPRFSHRASFSAQLMTHCC